MARQLLADWDNVEEAMHQCFTLQRGKISVAAMPSFAANVLPEVLKAFRDRYAGINVTVHDVINEQVIEMVREGRVEMGIAFEPAPTTTCCLPRWASTGLWRLCRKIPAGGKSACHGRSC
jgi:LysR family carnitine catabolism transcriptional activator